MRNKNSVMSPYLIIVLIFFVIALVFVARTMVAGQTSTEEQVCKTSLNKASIRYSQYVSGRTIGKANTDLIQCNAKVITIKDKSITTELLTSNGRYLIDETSATSNAKVNQFLANEINSCFDMAGTIEGSYCNSDFCILKCAHIRNERENPIRLDHDISDSNLDGYALFIGDNTEDIEYISTINTETEYILGVESFGEAAAQKRIFLDTITNAFSKTVLN